MERDLKKSRNSDPVDMHQSRLVSGTQNQFKFARSHPPKENYEVEMQSPQDPETSGKTRIIVMLPQTSEF